MRNINPYLCKSGYYVTEMIFGDVDLEYKLESTTDLKGPFKTVERARQVYKKMFPKQDHSNWNVGIRGPYHKRDRYKTIWYPTQEKELL